GTVGNFGRAGRDQRQPGGARSSARQARLFVRGHGRAAGQEYRSACACPSYCARRKIRLSRTGEGDINGSGTRVTRQAVDRGAAFQNMSGDPEQEYFADGMVEEITTALSRIRWLFVIARNSSFTYKGQAIDVKRVGRELGVRYVLEGSVRKAGNQVRITGELIDAATGTH